MNDSSRYAEFDRLMGKYRRLIERTCWYHADGDEALFADLVQESYIHLWHRYHTLNKDRLFPLERERVRWYCRSACSHYLRHKVPVFIPLDEDLADPDEGRAERELIEEISVDLSQRERQLLDLLLDGYKPREIAHIMGIKVSSVSQLRYRMLERMKETYTKIIQNDTRRN